MTSNKGKQAFLAVLTFIAFLMPLILVDELSLLTTWLYIFISWLTVILLSTLKPRKSQSKTSNANDIKLKE